MTSATTMLAMIPLIFAEDMGSRLQQPLAVVVIGGMFIGTLVSLYFIPICYYYLTKINNYPLNTSKKRLIQAVFSDATGHIL